MLCEKCRIREANIKYTEVMNGVKTEHNLCSQCAQEMDFGPYSAIIEGEFPLGKLLSSLLGLQPSAARQQKMDEVACPTCKTTYEEFVENSRFGCADCYHVFDLLIGEKIKKLQESATIRVNSRRFGRQEGRQPLPAAVSWNFPQRSSLSSWREGLSLRLKLRNMRKRQSAGDRIKALKEENEKNDEMV